MHCIFHFWPFFFVKNVGYFNQQVIIRHQRRTYFSMANNTEIGNNFATGGDPFLDSYLAHNGFRKVPINSPDYSTEREMLSKEIERLKEDREETKKNFDNQIKTSEEKLEKANQELCLKQDEIEKLKREIIGSDSQNFEQSNQIDKKNKEILRLQILLETERDNTKQRLAKLEQTTINQQTKLKKRTTTINHLQDKLNEKQDLFISFLTSVQQTVKFPGEMNQSTLTGSYLQFISNSIQAMTISMNQNNNELERLRQFKNSVTHAIHLTATFTDGNGSGLENTPVRNESFVGIVIDPKFKCKLPGCKAKFTFLSELRRHMKRTHHVENPLYRWKTGCKFCGEKFQQFSDLYHHRKLARYVIILISLYIIIHF